MIAILHVGDGNGSPAETTANLVATSRSMYHILPKEILPRAKNKMAENYFYTNYMYNFTSKGIQVSVPPFA